MKVPFWLSMIHTSITMRYIRTKRGIDIFLHVVVIVVGVGKKGKGTVAKTLGMR